MLQEEGNGIKGQVHIISHLDPGKVIITGPDELFNIGLQFPIICDSCSTE